MKKTVFFSSEKLQNPETPLPPSSNLEAPVFSDKEILEWARPPPPFWRKIPKYSQFFFDKIPLDWVRTPLLAKISQNPHF